MKYETKYVKGMIRKKFSEKYLIVFTKATLMPYSATLYSWKNR